MTDTQDQPTIEQTEPPEPCLQPFQQCARRDKQDALYSEFFKMNLEEEKAKIFQNNKQPRKPLSPYIFFSQEKRKEIKQQNNLSAKQIMKQVSKCWQDIKDDKAQTEKYEYLSLRDREAYSLLCQYCSTLKRENNRKQSDDERLTSLRSFDVVQPKPPSDKVIEPTQVQVIDTLPIIEEDQQPSSFDQNIVGNKQRESGLQLGKRLYQQANPEAELDPIEHQFKRMKPTPIETESLVMQTGIKRQNTCGGEKRDHNQMVEDICSQMSMNLSKNQIDFPNVGSIPCNNLEGFQKENIDQNVFMNFDFNSHANNNANQNYNQGYANQDSILEGIPVKTTLIQDEDRRKKALKLTKTQSSHSNVQQVVPNRQQSFNQIFESNNERQDGGQAEVPKVKIEGMVSSDDRAGMSAQQHASNETFGNRNDDVNSPQPIQGGEVPGIAQLVNPTLNGMDNQYGADQQLLRDDFIFAQQVPKVETFLPGYEGIRASSQDEDFQIQQEFDDSSQEQLTPMITPGFEQGQGETNMGDNLPKLQKQSISFQPTQPYSYPQQTDDSLLRAKIQMQAQQQALIDQQSLLNYNLLQQQFMQNYYNPTQNQNPFRPPAVSSENIPQVQSFDGSQYNASYPTQTINQLTAHVTPESRSPTADAGPKPTRSRKRTGRPVGRPRKNTQE